MSSTEFSVHTTADADRCVVTVSGEVDAQTASRLGQALEEAQRDGAASIVVDLDAVTFIDSTGLGALLTAYKQSAVLGIPLTVRNPKPSVTRIMEITGLHYLLS